MTVGEGGSSPSSLPPSTKKGEDGPSSFHGFITNGRANLKIKIAHLQPSHHLRGLPPSSSSPMDRSELLATMSRMKSMANASGALTREQALAIEASQSGETPLMGTPPPPPPLSASAAAAVAAAWEVELGFLEKGALPADWAIVDGGKAGGRPAWLDPLAAPPPAALRCGVCRTEMTFLVQCYAPLSGVPSAYHRVLYVWCCRNGTCLRENIGGAGAVKVFRCQLPRDHAYRGTASLNLGDCDAALPPRATLSADLTAAVECSRVEGNAAFKAQRWTDAIAAYAGALAHFDAARAEVWPSWDEKDDGDDGDELGGSSLWDAASAATERSLLCNLAAVHIKLGDAATALVFADRAVHADPSFAKAHYRRRVALQTLGRESLFSLERMTEYLSNILIY